MDNLLSNKKKLIGIALVLLILAVIPLSIYLVKHQQSTKSKASFSGTGAEFEDSSGNVLTQTSNRNIILKVQYDPNNTGGSTTGGGGGTTSDSCNFSGLSNGQTVGSSTSFQITATKSNPSYIIALWLINSNVGTTEVSAGGNENTLNFPNFNLSQSYSSGATATIECRIQTTPTGGTTIARNSVSVHIQ